MHCYFEPLQKSSHKVFGARNIDKTSSLAYSLGTCNECSASEHMCLAVCVPGCYCDATDGAPAGSMAYIMPKNGECGLCPALTTAITPPVTTPAASTTDHCSPCMLAVPRPSLRPFALAPQFLLQPQELILILPGRLHALPRQKSVITMSNRL